MSAPCRGDEKRQRRKASTAKPSKPCFLPSKPGLQKSGADSNIDLDRISSGALLGHEFSHSLPFAQVHFQPDSTRRQTPSRPRSAGPYVENMNIPDSGKSPCKRSKNLCFKGELQQPDCLNSRHWTVSPCKTHLSREEGLKDYFSCFIIEREWDEEQTRIEEHTSRVRLPQHAPI